MIQPAVLLGHIHSFKEFHEGELQRFLLFRGFLSLMVQNYHELEIFQLSYQFVLRIYPCFDQFPKTEQDNLILQMKRSVVSIPFNIAEGSSRRTDREFLPFLGYAFGSAKELEVSLNLSKDLGFLRVEDHALLYEDLQKIIAKLVLFMRHLEARSPRRKDVAMSSTSRGENFWQRKV